MNSKDSPAGEYDTLAIRVEPSEYLYCQYGEISGDAKPPLPICAKHMDITHICFIEGKIASENRIL